MVPLKGLRQPGRYRLQPCLLWPLDGGTSIDFQGAFADRVVTACFAKEAGFVSCFFLFFFFFLFVFHNFRLLVSESIFFFFGLLEFPLHFQPLQRLHGFPGETTRWEMEYSDLGEKLPSWPSGKAAPSTIQAPSRSPTS